MGSQVSNIAFAWQWRLNKTSLESVSIDESNPTYTVINNGIYRKNGEGVIDTLMATFGAIKEFTVPTGVKIINDSALGGGLEKVYLPDTVTTIKQSAFESSLITEIKIPNSVTYIHQEAFFGCNRLTKIEVDCKAGAIPNSPWGAPGGNKIVKWLR